MLSFENVDVSVSGTHILKNINVKFNKGEITTIIGPNGCGKTTLLSCLNSSAKVTAGHIMIDGTDFLSLPLTCQKGCFPATDTHGHTCTTCKNSC